MRGATLLAIAKTIVSKQSAFFASGDPAEIRPMILKDISAVTGLEILKISKNTILELLQNGYLDSFKIKGRYRITREALIEFITKSIYYC